MRVMLLFPKFYTVREAIKKSLESNGCEVYSYDYRDHIPDFYEKLNSKRLKMTKNWRIKWENYYFRKINIKHLENFNQLQPDLVLIYNNEMLLPATVKEFRRKAKVIFLLGDSPFYTPTSKYNLMLLFEADHIFCPDTGWIKQLEILGLDNLQFFITGSDSEFNFNKEGTKAEKEKYRSELVFIGGNYDHSWGYKRSLFLNEFTDMDFKLYGPPSWSNWFDKFPGLKKCFVPHVNGRLSFKEVNTIMNCAKIYPVDANPGILNGVHLRVFECISCGILPLVEYRKDIDTVFKGVNIPVIYNYKEAKKLASLYLADENLRYKTITELREHVRKNYSPRRSVEAMLRLL